MPKQIISASEMERYGYCPLSWYLDLKGIEAEGDEVNTGVEKHKEIGESLRAMTGWFRDGCCNTDNRDFGRLVVCVVMTDVFLAFSKGAGNDLSTPGPGFSGLKDGDRWCLCLSRWVEAYDSEMAPKVILEATHESALEMVSLEKLKEYAYKED